MNPDAHTEDIYEERIARYLELAAAAQEAAGRADSVSLQETYASLAGQWLHLAHMARNTVDRSRRRALARGDDRDARGHRMH